MKYIYYLYLVCNNNDDNKCKNLISLGDNFICYLYFL